MTSVCVSVNTLLLITALLASSVDLVTGRRVQVNWSRRPTALVHVMPGPQWLL